MNDTAPSNSLAAVWRDRELRTRLRNDPAAELKKYGIELPPEIAVRTVACKGSPVDVEDASLLQFLLERGERLSYFFTASARSPCAQQAAYGRIISRDLDDPVFVEYLRRDAMTAMRTLEAI